MADTEDAVLYVERCENVEDFFPGVTHAARVFFFTWGGSSTQAKAPLEGACGETDSRGAS